jgi:hypothetical protein
MVLPWAVTAAGARARRACDGRRRPRTGGAYAKRASPISTVPTVLIDLGLPRRRLLARLDGLGIEVTRLYGMTQTYGPGVVGRADARPKEIE